MTIGRVQLYCISYNLCALVSVCAFYIIPNSSFHIYKNIFVWIILLYYIIFVTLNILRTMHTVVAVVFGPPITTCYLVVICDFVKTYVCVRIKAIWPIGTSSETEFTTKSKIIMNDMQNANVCMCMYEILRQ